MKAILTFLICAAAVCAQPFSFGVKGGIPATDMVNAATVVAGGGSLTRTSAYQQINHRYIVGPTVELKLPAGFSIELDALYRHLNYSGQDTSASLTNSSRITDVKANAWEFPLLLKYRMRKGIVRPYVDAGVAWDTLTGMKESVQTTTNGILGRSSSSTPAELNKKSTSGFVMGAGLDIKALVIHISPEVRYTHWGSTHFLDALGALRSNRNQAEFLVGLTF